MFTGIVSHCGVIKHIETKTTGKRFQLSCDFSDLSNSESIAIDGTCLTVTDCSDNQFYCDLSPETLSKTIADDYEVGTMVNFERAMRATDRLGGHFVSGHVDETALLTQIDQLGEFVKMRFEPQQSSALKYVIPKGSIAISGVSLTINHVDDQGFDIMLIPHTLEITNLKYSEVGQSVNIEYDMLAKMVAKQVDVVVLND